MKKKTIPIMLSLLGIAICGLTAQTPAEQPTPAPASSPAPTAGPVTTPTPSGGDTTPPAGPRPASYTVVSGDSFWKIAHQFGISVKSLKKANPKIKSNDLKPGQVLQLPPETTPKPTTSVANPSPVAYAAEGFANTGNSEEAGEGVPVGNTLPSVDSSLDTKPATASDSTATSPPSTVSSSSPTHKISKTKRKKSTSHTVAHTKKAVKTPAPGISTSSAPAVAAGEEPMVSPDSPIQGGYYHAGGLVRKAGSPESASRPVVSNATSQPSPAGNALSRQQIASAAIGGFTPPPPMPVPQEHKGFFGFLSHDDSDEQSSWAVRFHQVAEELASHHISYGQSWRPPGESRSWVMDCSNTSRYIYKVATNLNLPRTASDQYFYLHLQNRAWDVPTTANNDPDVDYLRRHLKPGDLLFWENTYRPERQPPITHVMVFLGQDAQGKWLMAGSQGGHDGEHHHSGPDIYKFDPLAPSGGYTTWIGFVHHKGRFTAFGRPLAADPSKLASS